jgi:hypothetical protein
MYQFIKDETTGYFSITDSWVLGATGLDAPPIFNRQGDDFAYSFSSLTDIESIKSFTFSTWGSNETRYLTTFYRLSRDYTNWTSWLELNTNIQNFPPWTATDDMYLDIKFVRSGDSTINSIQLLSYSLNGRLRRNVVDGSAVITLNPQNKTAILKAPYIYKVFSISDIEIISVGNIGSVSMKWRYSQDYGRTVTQWEPFTKANVKSAKINPIRFFQLEYLLELTNNTDTVQIYDINLIGDFQNVTQDYFKTNLFGVREDCNCLVLGIINDPSTAMDESVPVGGQSGLLTSTQDPNPLPQLTQDQKNALFKPYQLTAATNLLDKMSNDAVDIFGHDVVYFLTDPDKNGIDFTFHEYQLYNYVCSEDIKVSVENNQFPENTGAINQFDLSLFDSFEIHITKKNFKETFGPEKRPSKEDFLWFCEINRMFTVEHAQQYRGFNNNAIYWKIMLKKYNQKANVIGGNQTITDKLKQLTNNSTINELFGRENTDDKNSVANLEQLRPLTFDKLRVEVVATIEKELIENAEIVISKTNYDLSSVGFGQDAIIYRNMQQLFQLSDNLGFICWFNLNNYVVNDIYTFFKYYDDDNMLGFKMELSADNIRVTVNSDSYNMPLGVTGGANGLVEGEWYAYLVNIDQRQQKIHQYIYQRYDEDGINLNNTYLNKVYDLELDMIPHEFQIENIPAKLLGSDMKITNIRLFSDVIPEDTHTKILNQSIIGVDSKYLIFADNANTQIVLPNYPLGQIAPNQPGYKPMS